jgi:predicted HNH restriction endonuclease
MSYKTLERLKHLQIPVCTTCHGKIHRGEYDHFKLSEMTYIPR